MCAGLTAVGRLPVHGFPNNRPGAGAGRHVGMTQTPVETLCCTSSPFGDPEPSVHSHDVRVRYHRGRGIDPSPLKTGSKRNCAGLVRLSASGTSRAP